MAHELRNGNTTEDRKLDRIPAFDPRSLDHRVFTLLGPSQQTTQTKIWNAPLGTPVLDQGNEGACTGFGVTNGLLYGPNPTKGLDATFAKEKVYWQAQRDDPWAGGAYPGAKPHYDGTAVLYAVKVANKLGYYIEYHWATSEPEMALGVTHVAPAIIGVNWYAGMFEPGSNGFISPTGSLQGGHYIAVIGLDVQKDGYIVHNSWGPTWGGKGGTAPGNAMIRRSDMARLLRENGECCIITKKPTNVLSTTQQMLTERLLTRLKSDEAGNAAMGQAA